MGPTAVRAVRPPIARWARRGAIAALTVLVALPGAVIGAAHGDPDALWKIVNRQCVADQLRHGDPAPCARVDVGAGELRGFAVLKDRVGARQFLLIPTARITGIESPLLLAPDAPNYFAAAWRARSFVDERAGWRLPRDWVSLAVNSEPSRTQNQLHIHLDCVRADVHDALAENAAQIGELWAPLPVPLAGDRYSAMRISGDDLDQINPFVLLADGIAGARDRMGEQTLAVIGAADPDGRPGFVIVTDQMGPAGGSAASEALQDHDACPPPPRA